jgi:hypothetical protein
MSYEFNPDTQVFEFPNPYKVENLALIAAGALMTVAGIGTMIAVRERIAAGVDAKALAVVGISIILLLFGIGLLAWAFTQLRFFFGRNRPASLAKPIAQDADGDSPDAAWYKETLRQNAITFKEPSGALNGLLYSWLPHLIFAPRVIQVAGQTQFYNFLALGATFISFLICWMLFGQGPASNWIGVAYGGFAFYQIMRPMLKRSVPAAGPIYEGANVGKGSLIALILLAVLGPVVLGMASARLPLLGVAVNSVVLVALLCALLGCAVFGMALKNQLQPAPQVVGAARVTETLTMNAHPNKLVEELDRMLMARWYGNIPNRRYTRRSPDASAKQGRFVAEMLEETQPRPQPSRIATSLGHALSSPKFLWQTCLTGLGTLNVLAATVAAVLATRTIVAGEPVATTIVFALSQFAVGTFCIHAAHVLWGRFDFTSELIWVDISGSYESAQMHIGNQISGNVQTMKNVINIESMTMRVWVSEIDTVVFGKDDARQLVGMRGLQGMADELSASLKGFGETRSMVVAPTSAQDMERAQKIGMVGQLVSQPMTPPSTLLATAGLASAQPAATAECVRCPKCNAVADDDARFCGECGTRL